MDKEQILQMSRKENEGKQDEREQHLEDRSFAYARMVGMLVCVALVLVSEFVIINPDVSHAAWLVFFAMEATSDLYLYRQNHKTSKLVWAILSALCVIGNIFLLFA